MPVVADPADDAQRKINAAVKRLDATVRKAVAQCLKDGGKDADWERGVAVTMRGPRFLSYMISDDASCGGLHPNTSIMSIVYDLDTGQPVDWIKFLPPALIGSQALAEGMDGTRMVTLSSPLLRALYLTQYRPRSDPEKKTAADDEECRDAVASAGDGHPAMMAWLDADGDGLALQLDLPHVMQACADTLVIPVEALRALGAAPALADAIAAAHASARSP